MAAARVLDVGNCNPDHAAIRALLERNFDVAVDRVMYVNEATDALRRDPYDLVLVNRLIFADHSDGLDLIRAMQGDPSLASVPALLVSNYPEAQSAATAAGARPGFGKAHLQDHQTVDLLAQYLPRRA